MKCLLVLPAHIAEEHKHLIPSGISCISAAMKRLPGIETINLNLNLNPNIEVIESLIADEKIEAVLSGGLYTDLKCMRSVFETAKKINPNIITISGGPLISGDPIPAMKALEFADYGIIGEGELTVSELCLAIKNKATASQISRIDGLVIKENQGAAYRLTAPRAPITDWAQITWPDYEGFGLKILTKPSEGQLLRPPINVSTGRGCPFRCTFCHNSSGKIHRPRPLDDFRAEIEYLKNYYGDMQISILDDLLASSKTRLREVCKIFKDYSITHWGGNFRVTQIDEECLDIIQDADCSGLFFGLESACDPILKSMNKQISVRDIEKALKLMHQRRLPATGYFIFGDSEETVETAEETINWWKEHPDYDITLGMIMLFPGTILYRRALEAGKIKDPVDFLKNGLPLVNISKMSDDEYQALQTRLLKLNAEHQKKEQFFPSTLEISYDPPKFSKTIKAICKNCGKLIEGRLGIQDFNLVCPHCNTGHTLPPPDRDLKKALLVKLSHMAEHDGPIAVWGIGKVFHDFLEAGQLSHPNIYLLDINVDKKSIDGTIIHQPNFLKENKVKTVISTVTPGTVPHLTIQDEAIQKYKAENVISIYQLL